MAKKSRPTSFLPDDVVGEVLLRLPSKSLARFCSVCRSWKHLISSPAFVESHQALAAAKRPTKFAFAPTAPPHRWSLSACYDEPCYECPRVIGHKPCRGLVLLGQRCTRTYSVCNPSTGGRLRLPPCLAGYPYIKSSAGIGFHEPTGEYKVVVIAPSTDYRPKRCEVLTVGDPAGWRAPAGGSSSMPRTLDVDVKLDPVLADGCLHWQLGCRNYSEHHGTVIVFSLAGESFRLVPLPPFANDDVRRCYLDENKRLPTANPRKPAYIRCTTPVGPVLAELGGRLCMLRDLRHRHDVDGTLEVWRLDDYDSGAWSLSYRVDLAEHAAKRLMTTWFVAPLCYLAGDCDSSDRIMLATTMQEVHVYDPKTRTLETVLSVVNVGEAATSPERENVTDEVQQGSPFSLYDDRSEDLPSSKDYLRFVMFQESLVHLEGMEYGNSELEILDACVSDKYSIYV